MTGAVWRAWVFHMTGVLLCVVVWHDWCGVMRVVVWCDRRYGV